MREGEIVRSLVVLAVLVCAPLYAQSTLFGYDDIDNVCSLQRSPPYTDPPLVQEGFNPDVGLTFETLWPVDGLRPVPATALLMTVVSTDLDDTAAGSGAQQVAVFCLDDTYAPFVELVELDGTTPVAMITDCFRIQEFRVTRLSVPRTFNQGDLRIENSGTLYEIIIAGHNVDHTVAVTVPAGRVGYLTPVQLSVDIGQTTFVRLHFTSAGGITTFATQHVEHEFEYHTPFCIPSGMDVELQAEASIGGAGGVSSTLRIVLYDSLTGLCPL